MVFMVDYMITAQAEVLYEKAYHILPKYSQVTSNKEREYPCCLDDMKVDIVKLAKRVILSETQADIDQALMSLNVYENIINNISQLSKSGVSV